jgi:hypothetical protein
LVSAFRFVDGLEVGQEFVGVVVALGLLDGQERVERLLVCHHPHHLVRQQYRERHAQVNRVYLDEPKTVAHAHSVLPNEHFVYGRQHSLAVHRYRQSDSRCVALRPIRKTVHNGL